VIGAGMAYRSPALDAAADLVADDAERPFRGSSTGLRSEQPHTGPFRE
jgi:hypothetical protein